MPQDLSIIQPLRQVGQPKDYLRATGDTQFIFQTYENDLQFNNLKQLYTFSGLPKLVQAIMRAAITPLGSYFEDRAWGSEMDGNIGSKMDNEAFAIARQSIIDALTHYNVLNFDNPNSDEVISTIDELQVVQDLNDPRVMRVVIGVTTESGLSTRVVVPQVDK